MVVFAIIVLFGLIVFGLGSIPVKETPDWQKTLGRPPSSAKGRKDWYRNVYLKSDAWRRKRYVVLRRDEWTCVRCGNRANQVHHKRYLGRNLGKEPIDWLISVCHSCHNYYHT